ncbi:MAG TPA: sigma-70 family RNA polymerase sigma factor [Desulfobulbus sp.]|nr:sigma-70 family RNA polymerase sigma factor [Desulfobulbus sp.]
MFAFRKKNKKQLFRDLAFVHVPFLYNMALKYSGNRYDAEDMVQETMLIAFEKFHQLRDQAKCRSWLFSILRNTFFKEKKRAARAPLPFDNDHYLSLLDTMAGEGEISHLLEERELATQVRRAMDDLPEQYRTVLLLYYMEEMRYRDIAELLEAPIGTVMSRLNRGRTYLKRVMLEYLKREEAGGKIVRLSEKRRQHGASPSVQEVNHEAR